MADNNVQEKRWAKRIAINATIRLNSLNTDPAISYGIYNGKTSAS